MTVAQTMRVGNCWRRRHSTARQTLADALLVPHRSYRDEVVTLLNAQLPQGMAHITGGGLPGNVARIIPDGLTAEIDASAWTPSALFQYVCERGNVGAGRTLSSVQHGHRLRDRDTRGRRRTGASAASRTSHDWTGACSSWRSGRAIVSNLTLTTRNQPTPVNNATGKRLAPDWRPCSCSTVSIPT